MTNSINNEAIYMTIWNIILLLWQEENVHIHKHTAISCLWTDKMLHCSLRCILVTGISTSFYWSYLYWINWQLDILILFCYLNDIVVSIWLSIILSYRLSPIQSRYWSRYMIQIQPRHPFSDSVFSCPNV